MSNKLNLTLKVWRQESSDSHGDFVDYSMEGVNPHMSFLELLDVLNEKLAVSLSGNELQIMRVDLGDGKGIWWRIVTNTIPRGEAETVCALLKSEGNNCIVRSR